jgi:hypothetical protein
MRLQNRFFAAIRDCPGTQLEHRTTGIRGFDGTIRRDFRREGQSAIDRCNQSMLRPTTQGRSVDDHRRSERHATPLMFTDTAGLRVLKASKSSAGEPLNRRS